MPDHRDGIPDLRGIMQELQNFDIEFESEVALAWDRLQERAQELGVTFIGTEKEGRFFGSGMVGHYSVKGNLIGVTITVLDFPASEMYTEDTLRDALKRFFLSAMAKG